MAATIDSRSEEIADDFSVSTALLYRLKQKGKQRFWKGGINITQALAYQKNQSFKWISGYEKADITPSDVFTLASYAPKQGVISVSISVLEQLQNSGKEAMFDLLEERIDNGFTSIMQEVGLAMYSDGTGSGGKQIGGLNHLIPSDPTTGTVGGINRALWSFWQPQLYDFSGGGLQTGGAITASSTTIQAAMNTMYLNTMRPGGKDSVDLIAADNTYYGYYWASLQGNQRFTNSKMAEAGFENIRFMGADVVPDGGLSGGIDANTMFFLNTNYLFWRPHVNANFVSADPATRYSTDQLALVKLIHVAGNMTCSNSKLQGRIQA